MCFYLILLPVGELIALTTFQYYKLFIIIAFIVIAYKVLVEVILRRNDL